MNENQEKDQKKRIATVRHPTIEAIVAQLFRFAEEEQAVERLNTIRDFFMISAKLPQEESGKTLKLWIKGFQITPKEEEKGFRGNFALIKPILLEDGKYTLGAEKLDVALKYHPQKKRPKHKHPDWGHPLLRFIKKEPQFDDIETARDILLQLHEEYPDVSIPTVNKLYIIIYTKTVQPPIEKYVLEIKAREEGVGFFIDYYLNTYEKEELPGQIGKGEDSKESKATVQGKFTTMVELKRKRKPMTTMRPTSQVKDDSEEDVKPLPTSPVQDNQNGSDES